MQSTISDAQQNSKIALIVILVPTIMLILGLILNPYPPSELAQQLVLIPLFFGLIMLGIGFFLRNKINAAKWKIGGWGIFAFFWATSPAYLYFSEGGDVFNSVVSIIGVYILIYIAYHEWLSIKTNTFPTCLNWIAGASFLAGIIYFIIDSGLFPIIKTWFIEVVAFQSNAVLNLVGINSVLQGSVIILNGHPITIIFACTAIQSIVLFVGMIGALPQAPIQKKMIGLAITVLPIYFLNLIRNAGVIFLIGNNITSFNMAHNVIAKIGSLIALIILLFITFKILPSLYDEIMCLIDLPKRKGPVEIFFGQFMEKSPK
jgi:archaeosortase A (PGF-CTERM-specific)